MIDFFHGLCMLLFNVKCQKCCLAAAKDYRSTITKAMRRPWTLLQRELSSTSLLVYNVIL